MKKILGALFVISLPIAFFVCGGYAIVKGNLSKSTDPQLPTTEESLNGAQSGSAELPKEAELGAPKENVESLKNPSSEASLNQETSQEPQEAVEEKQIKQNPVVAQNEAMKNNEALNNNEAQASALSVKAPSDKALRNSNLSAKASSGRHLSKKAKAKLAAKARKAAKLAAHRHHKKEEPMLTAEEQSSLKHSHKLMAKSQEFKMGKMETENDHEANLVVNQLTQELSDNDDPKLGSKNEMSNKAFESEVYK